MKKTKINLSVEELACILKETEKAHAKFEKTLGKRDKNWQEWYARFIIERIK